MGYRWKGALNIGGGGAVNGQPLEDMGGGMGTHLRETLDLAAVAVTDGEPIPSAVTKRLEKPLYPPWLAPVIGEVSWRVQARRKGVKGSLKSKQYDVEG